MRTKSYQSCFHLDGEMAPDFYGVYIDAVAPGHENLPYSTDPINAPPSSNVIVSVVLDRKC